MPSSPLLHPFFASAAPGLEPCVLRELSTLGMRPRPEHGGAFWKGSWRDLYRASLGLRTASTILVRIKGCEVKTFGELEIELKGLPWGRWVHRNDSFRVVAACRASELYHEGAVEERVAEWISRKTGGKWEAASREPAGISDEEGAPEDAQSPPQRFVVRIVRNQLQLSVDACGLPLHRRGYRLALGKAPLRETLAAGLLLASGWIPAVQEGLGRGAAVRYKSPERPLDDPFCGSGTIPIEAALLARRIPPAMANPSLTPRAFAFQAWEDFDETDWKKTVESLRSHVLPANVVVTGGDRDEGVVQAARANAERAGVGDDVGFRHAAFSAAEWEPGTFVVTNPPYGSRVSETSDLRDLFSAFGAKLRASSEVTALWLDGSEQGERATKIEWAEVFRSKNGGLPVRALKYRS